MSGLRTIECELRRLQRLRGRVRFDDELARAAPVIRAELAAARAHLAQCERQFAALQTNPWASIPEISDLERSK